MPLDSITIRLTDGIKTADYAPNKVYDLTAILSNPTDEEVAKAATLIVKTGEAFLGRAPTAANVATEKTTKAKNAASKAEPPATAPAPLPTDPAPPASAPTTAAEAGSPSTSEPTSDVGSILGAASEPAKEITNDEIIHAGMQANERLKGDTKKIRDLIETYNPQPGLRVFKATEIDQKDRVGFLAKLKELA